MAFLVISEEPMMIYFVSDGKAIKIILETKIFLTFIESYLLQGFLYLTNFADFLKPIWQSQNR